ATSPRRARADSETSSTRPTVWPIDEAQSPREARDMEARKDADIIRDSLTAEELGRVQTQLSTWTAKPIDPAVNDGLTIKNY
ncbi:MAG: hypothetical protein AAF603_08135, partial [Pseudomonadota bacterium]